jgi:CBS domain-containing protein
MKVEQLMTKDPRTCTAEDALSEAARIMWEYDCGCVPVVTGEGSRRIVAVVTDRDVCMAAYTQGRPLWEIPVRAAMSSEAWTCHPDDALKDAVRTMRHRQVRRLPVVDAQGHLLGLLSLTDVALAASDAAAVQAARRRASKRDAAEEGGGADRKARPPRAARGVSKSELADALADISRVHAEREPGDPA